MLSYYIKFKGKSYKIKLQLVEKAIFYANQEFRLSMSGEWGHSPRQAAVGSVPTAHLHLNP